MQFQIQLADPCQTSQVDRFCGEVGKFIVTGFGFAGIGVWFDGLSFFESFCLETISNKNLWKSV